MAESKLEQKQDDKDKTNTSEAVPTGITSTGEAAKADAEAESRRGKIVDELHDHIVDKLKDLDGRQTKDVLDDIARRISTRKVVAAAPRSRMRPSDVEALEAKVPYITPSPAKGEPPVRNTLDNEESRLGDSGKLSK